MKYEKMEFEFKKERVYENSYFFTYLVIYAVESEKTKVDQEL